MVLKEFQSYIIECDICGEHVDNFKSFQDAIDYAKDNGWKSIKVGNEWMMECSNRKSVGNEWMMECSNCK